MTKYRTVSDGYAKHMQYLHEEKSLFFFTTKKWCYVWWPYYDRIWGRSLDGGGYKTYVCSYNNDLSLFPKKWPDIEKYFEWANKEQERMESVAAKRQAEINENKGRIEYL